jgi:hypothetical protein
LDWLNKAIIVTLQDGKEAVSEIQSDLENRVYHDQEGDKVFSGGQHMDSQSPLTKKKSNQHLFKDIISTVTDSDELYILDWD